MKNTEFVKKAKDALNYKTIYGWGGFGNPATLTRINQFAKRYPAYYSTGLINHLKANTDAYMVDCCGLIKSVFMGCIPNVEYQSKYDKDSDGITIGNATEVGPISTLPEIPGILLQMDGHCGIYIGNGQVLESTPNETIAKRKYGGVCISKLSDRNWLKWAKSKWIEYEEVVPDTYTVVAGDTLIGIADKYGLNWKDIQKYNYIQNTRDIDIGTVLYLKEYAPKIEEPKVEVTEPEVEEPKQENPVEQPIEIPVEDDAKIGKLLKSIVDMIIKLFKLIFKG